MPPPELSGRLQDAVLWESQGRQGHYGEHKVRPPVQILVRWQDGRSEAVDPDGNKIGLDATVVAPDCEIPIGSIMWKGCLADWYGTGSGASELDMMEVRTRSTAPDIKNRFSFRTLGLARFRGELPELR